MEVVQSANMVRVSIKTYKIIHLSVRDGDHILTALLSDLRSNTPHSADRLRRRNTEFLSDSNVKTSVCFSNLGVC